jgi:hypothetical protein
MGKAAHIYLAEVQRGQELVGRGHLPQLGAVDRALDARYGCRVDGCEPMPGQDEPARRAYRVALQAAAVAGDRDLAGYVLGSLSHLSLAEDADEALLLARSGHTGVRNGGSPLTRALLLHRVALAAARVHERRTADTALAEAQWLAEQCRSGSRRGSTGSTRASWRR